MQPRGSGSVPRAWWAGCIASPLVTLCLGFTKARNSCRMIARAQSDPRPSPVPPVSCRGACRDARLVSWCVSGRRVGMLRGLDFGRALYSPRLRAPRYVNRQGQPCRARGSSGVRRGAGTYKSVRTTGRDRDDESTRVIPVRGTRYRSERDERPTRERSGRVELNQIC